MDIEVKAKAAINMFYYIYILYLRQIVLSLSFHDRIHCVNNAKKADISKDIYQSCTCNWHV